MYPNQTNQANQPKKNKQDSIQDFMREHRNLSMVIILAVFGVLLTIIALLINLFGFTEPNGNTVPERAPYTYFEHRYLINSSIGQDVANQVLLNITDIIVSDEEINSAPEPNSADPTNQYTVNISEESYRRTTYHASYVFDMTLKLSDKREYLLHILTDENYGQSYIVVILERSDTSSDADYVIIYVDNLETYSSIINQWVSTYNLNNPQRSSHKLPATVQN